MDSALLKVFVTVADEGSLSGAAKILNCVQSNVTARLKQLEDYLGHRLFYRKPRGVILTEAGEVLLGHARDIVERIGKTELVMRNLGETAGRLRIGSTESNAAVRLTPLLIDLHKKYPKVDFQLFTGTTQLIIEQLIGYKLDIAFVSGVPNHPDLKVLKAFEEKMALVEPKAGAVPDVVITFKKGCTYKAVLDELMRERGIYDYRVMEFGSLDTILGCVAAGMGRTLLPLSVINQSADKNWVNIVSLPPDKADIPTCLICRRDAMPSIKLDMFELEGV